MLLVIDMQPRFPATRAVMSNVAEEIKRAIARDEWIVFMKVGPGRVAYRLTKLVKDYRKSWMLTKYRDDGAADLFIALTWRSKAWNAITIGRVQTIKVCGVNTAACVYSTVRSLALLNVKIKVLAYATAQCRDGYSYGYNKAAFHQSLQAMNRLSNVQVIRKR
jgi:nicotinamidase-related amidase